MKIPPHKTYPGFATRHAEQLRREKYEKRLRQACEQMAFQAVAIQRLQPGDLERIKELTEELIAEAKAAQNGEE